MPSVPALRCSPPVPMIKLTKEREIDLYPLVPPEEERRGRGSLVRAFLSAIGTLQAANRHNNVGSLKHLNQPVKEALIIVRPGLEIFFQDTLRVAHCLKRYLLVGHQRLPSGYNLDALNNPTENNWFQRRPRHPSGAYRRTAHTSTLTNYD